MYENIGFQGDPTQVCITNLLTAILGQIKAPLSIQCPRLTKAHT